MSTKSLKSQFTTRGSYNQLKTIKEFKTAKWLWITLMCQEQLGKELDRFILIIFLVKFYFFPHPISFFHVFIHPLFGVWSPQPCQPLYVAKLLLLAAVLIAERISSVYRWCHNPFTQKKDSCSLFPVYGILIPVTFFKESKSLVMHIYFNWHQKLLAYCRDWTWVPTGNNL